MDEFGDPLQYQQQQLARQAQLADALRKRAIAQGTPQMPQGQMVSGHYIAPHWSETLAAALQPAISGYQAQQAERGLAQGQQGLAGAVEQARNAWLKNMPQVTPGQEAQPGVSMSDLANPATPVGTTTSPDIPAVQAKLPSAMEQAQYLAQGARIPGNEGLAGAVQKIMGEAVTREDKQQEARQNLKATLQARREEVIIKAQERMHEASLRSQDTRLSIEQRAQAASEATVAKRDVAVMMQGAAQSNRDWQHGFAEDQQVQRVITHIVDKGAPLANLTVKAQDVQDMVDRYDAQKKKIPGLGHTGIIPDFFQTPEGTAARAKIAAFAQALIQSQAGLSQTLSEQELTKATILSKPSFSEKDFRENWPSVVANLNQNVQHLKSINPKAWDQYKTNGGPLDLVKSGRQQTAGVPNSSDRPLTPAELAEYQKLKAVATTGSF